MSQIPDGLLAYLSARESAASMAVARVITNLTEREVLLIQESTVAGYAQGLVDAGAYGNAFPSSGTLVFQTLDAALAFPALYPTIAAAGEGKPA